MSLEVTDQVMALWLGQCWPNFMMLYDVTSHIELINSLWPSATIWLYRSGSTLASRHQAITWTNIDLSSKVFCGIHLGAISQKVYMNLIHNICSEITLLELLPHLPQVNELILQSVRKKVSEKSSLWQPWNYVLLNSTPPQPHDD